MNKRQTILILGGKGLLGAELADFFKRSSRYTPIPLGHKEGDVTDERKLARTFLRHQPDVIINCAALINVERCETEPFEAWRVNAFGAGAVAHAARRSGLSPTVIHISSAYVFGDDKSTFCEDDEARPVNSYGAAKSAGETLFAAEAGAAGMRHFVIRTSWLYGRFRDTLADTVVKVLRQSKPFEVVSDQWSVVTSARDFAEGVQELLENKRYKSGVYHFFDKSRGGVTRYGIALVVAKTLGFDPTLLKKVPRSKIFRVPYPRSAVLQNTKFRVFPNWKKSLQAYLIQRYGQKNKN